MEIKKDLLKGGTALMVLSLLEQKPMYGYEMIKAIENLSQGTFVFKEGTLYPLLHRLEKEGSLYSYWSGQAGSRQRKYYEITPYGKKQLELQKNEWNIVSSGLNQVINLGRSGL